MKPSIGGKAHNKHANKRQHPGGGASGKEPVLALVERGGWAASHHVADVTAATLVRQSTGWRRPPMIRISAARNDGSWQC
jgi:hypothetical protein